MKDFIVVDPRYQFFAVNSMCGSFAM